MEGQESNPKKQSGQQPLSDKEMLELITAPEMSSIAPAVNKEYPPHDKEVKKSSTSNNEEKTKKLYESLFMHGGNISGANSKVVYIHPDFHRRLTRILQIIGEDRISLFTYIHRILEYHFKEFEKEIISDFNRKNNEPIL